MDYEKHPELLGYIIFQANSTEPHSLARSLNGYSATQRKEMIAEAKKNPSKLFDWLMSHGHGLLGLRHNGDMQVAWRLIKHLRTIASRSVFMYVVCFAFLHVMCFDYLYFCVMCLLMKRKNRSNESRNNEENTIEIEMNSREKGSCHTRNNIAFILGMGSTTTTCAFESKSFLATSCPCSRNTSCLF